MGKLSDVFPLPSTGKELKNQIFTSSGTFTPSTKLLANGGWVRVILVGGGGGGYNGSWQASADGAGSGGVFIYLVKISGATSVQIGSGGTSSPGGVSKFGNVIASGGSGTIQSGGGFGQNGTPGGASGVTGLGGKTPYFNSAGTINYGAGGTGGPKSDEYLPGYPGTSGYCEVFWEE